MSEEKDLGIRITNDLKAFAHCAYVCSRANRVLGMINRTMVYIDIADDPLLIIGFTKAILQTAVYDMRDLFCDLIFCILCAIN